MNISNRKRPDGRTGLANRRLQVALVSVGLVLVVFGFLEVGQYVCGGLGTASGEVCLTPVSTYLTSSILVGLGGMLIVTGLWRVIGSGERRQRAYQVSIGLMVVAILLLGLGLTFAAISNTYLTNEIKTEWTWALVVGRLTAVSGGTPTMIIFGSPAVGYISSQVRNCGNCPEYQVYLKTGETYAVTIDYLNMQGVTQTCGAAPPSFVVNNPIQSSSPTFFVGSVIQSIQQDFLCT